MKKIILFCLLTFISSSIFSQSNPEDLKLKELYAKLKYTNYADLNITKTGIDLLFANGSKEAQDIIAIKDFATEMLGLKGVILSPEQRQQVYNESNSICEIVNITWNIGSFNSELGAVGAYPFEIGFYFCDSTYYKFQFNLNVTGLTTTIAKPMKKAFFRHLSEPATYIDNQTNKPKYDVIVNPLKLKSTGTIYPLDKLNEFLSKKNDLDNIEGTYEVYSSINPTSIKKMALIKSNNNYLIVVLENSYFKNDWSYGEIRGELIPTSSNKLMVGKYLALNKMSKKNISFNSINESLIEIIIDSDKQKLTFVKL